MSRALIISCNYTQFNCRLYGCYNDADNFMSYLKRTYPTISIINMRDSLPKNNQYYPTKNNILRELSNLGKAKENLLFFFYSGHGSYTTDSNNDESSILNAPFGSNINDLQGLLKDSCLVSNDINYLNLVRDDDICTSLSNLRSTQKLYAFTDCCHAGTILDLYNVNVANYSGRFTNTIIDKLIPEVNTKCSIINSNYPNKINAIKGNVILFSGTRDNAYSYESYINNKVSGHFTTQLLKILNYGPSKLNLKQFYLLLVGLLNNPDQIPVLTTSLNLNLDTSTSDLGPIKITTTNKKPVKSKSKNKNAKNNTKKNTIIIKSNITFDSVAIKLYLLNKNKNKKH